MLQPGAGCRRLLSPKFAFLTLEKSSEAVHGPVDLAILSEETVLSFDCERKLVAVHSNKLVHHVVRGRIKALD